MGVHRTCGEPNEHGGASVRAGSLPKSRKLPTLALSFYSFPFFPFFLRYGAAIASVLFGDVNPSGKLAITFPVTENDMNITQAMWPGTNSPAGMSSYYAEKLEVGYRWYTAHKVKAAFPFGHGLSYTKFAYSDVTATSKQVTVTVTNTGSVQGSEVAQLYLGFPASAGEPPLQVRRAAYQPMRGPCAERGCVWDTRATVL